MSVSERLHTYPSRYQLTFVGLGKGSVRSHSDTVINPLTSNSPYCQPNNSYNVSLENLVLDQPIIPKLIFFPILITCLVDIVLIL